MGSRVLGGYGLELPTESRMVLSIGLAENWLDKILRN